MKAYSLHVHERWVTSTRLLVGLSVAILLVASACSSSTESTAEGSRGSSQEQALAEPTNVVERTVATIEYGTDGCPLISLLDLSSAFRELGEPIESFSQGGAQFVCNFAAVDDQSILLEVTGGATGLAIPLEWDGWVGSPQGPEVLREVTLNDVPMVVLSSPVDNHTVHFRGRDGYVWAVDAAHPNADRAIEVEFTLARLLALS